MFVARMDLQCRHILQSRAYLDMTLFDTELRSKRWTADYYQTLSQVKFALPSWMRAMKIVMTPLAKYPLIQRRQTQKS